MTLMKTARRSLLRAWGRWGRASGWYYQVAESWAPKIANGQPFDATLPNGCRVRCDLHDSVQRAIYFFGAFEPVDSYLFLKLIQPGMTVVDAGANIGQYTLLASRAVGPQGQVHSFEPVPAIYQKLDEHMRMNAISNVRLNRIALWNRSEPVRLSLPRDMYGNIGAYSIGVDNPEREVESPAVPLDEYVRASDTGRIGLIKMDLNGGELFALRGMRQILEHDRPTMLLEIARPCFERAGYRLQDVWNLLVDELGYRVWAFGDSPEQCRTLTSFEGIEVTNVLVHDQDLPQDVTTGWNLKSILQWARSSLYL